MTDTPAPAADTPRVDAAAPPEADAPARRPARTLRANFAINVAGALVPLAVSLVTVPIYIRHIGDARYGVLSIVWVLLGYFGFLDLGLSRAAANALARLRDAPQEARARVLVTTLVLNLGMGLVGSLALALAGSYLLQHVLNVPEALKPEIASAFPWIVALFPLALVSGVGIGALESREEFLRANILQVVGTSLGQIVPVMLAVGVGPSLAVVIPAAVVARGLTAIAILGSVARLEGPLTAAHFDRGSVKALLRYGGWVSVTAVVGPILTSIDQFVIGSVLGVVALTHYAVPMGLISRSQVFATALSRTVFPRMSSASPSEAKYLSARALVMMSHGYATLCVPCIALAPLLLKTWINQDFANIAAPVTEVLFIGAWINCIALVPYNLLQSQGRPDITGKFHVLELAPFLFVLWSLSNTFGTVGAAYAWTFRCTLDAALLLRAARVDIRALAAALTAAPLLLASVLLANTLSDRPVVSLAVAGGLALAAAAISFWASPDARQLILRVISSASLGGRLVSSSPRCIKVELAE